MKLFIIETSAVSSEVLKKLIKEKDPSVQIQEIIDSSLLDEVVENGGVTPFIRHRMLTYYQFAEEMGADVILNQCSSVGDVAFWAKDKVSVPIIQIDKGMAVKAVQSAKKIGMVATVNTTVEPSKHNILRTAKELNKEIELHTYLVDGAMELLIKTGDVETHNKMVIDTVYKAAEENDIVVLAQGSMIVLMDKLKDLKVPVLSSPQLGVDYLFEQLKKNL